MPLLASADNSGNCGDGFTYYYEESTHTLTISGEGYIERHNNIELHPWFSYREDIINVITEPGIFLIGDGAFNGCSSMTSISIPEGLITIGSYAFRNCRSLKSITIPKSLTRIESWAFEGCSELSIYMVMI